jgi:hypothetical protein
MLSRRRIRHPRHLLGHAVGLLFVFVSGLADLQFSLNKMAKRLIAERASELMHRARWRPRRRRSGRNHHRRFFIRLFVCETLHCHSHSPCQSKSRLVRRPLYFGGF